MISSIFQRSCTLTGKITKNHARQKSWRGTTYNELLENLSHATGLSVDEIKWHHTYLPAGRSFNLNNEEIRADDKYVHMMCEQCIHEDLRTYGVAYVHRSHNFKHVQHCHKHGTQLNEYCRQCQAPHYGHAFKGYSLCITTQLTIEDQAIGHTTEVNYAKFVHGTLNQRYSPKSVNTFRNLVLVQTHRLGLKSQAASFNEKLVFSYIAKQFSGTHLPSTFSIHALTMLSSTVLAFGLFTNSSNFVSALQCREPKVVLKIQSARQRLVERLSGKTINSTYSLAATELELYQWLIENDNAWFRYTMQRHGIQPIGTLKSDLQTIQILNACISLQKSQGRPTRITKYNLLDSINFRTRHRHTLDKGMSTAIFSCIESYDHYNIRKIIWGARQIKKPTTYSSELSRFCKIDPSQLKHLLTDLRWIDEAGTIHLCRIPAHISLLNIPWNWTRQPKPDKTMDLPTNTILE